MVQPAYSSMVEPYDLDMHLKRAKTTKPASSATLFHSRAKFGRDRRPAVVKTTNLSGKFIKEKFMSIDKFSNLL